MKTFILARMLALTATSGLVVGARSAAAEELGSGSGGR
jgi:hypothetical protein